jgi:predicted negative regulator of RcsB-dependent stress response
VVAKLGNGVITEELVASSYRYARAPDKETKIATLKQLVEPRLFHLAAQDQGYTRNEELNRRFRSIKKRVLHHQLKATLLNQQANVPIETLKAYYNSNTQKFLEDSSATTFSEALPEVVNAYILEKANIDSFYHANAGVFGSIGKQDTILPDLEDIRSRVEEEYLNDYRRQLSEVFQPELFDKYNVQKKEQKASIGEKELRASYEKNAERYLNKESYEVYHIELDQREALESIANSVNSLEHFKGLASQYSSNKWTKKQGGYIGFVKKSHSFPYGIGTFPQVFLVLDNLLESNKDFKVTEPTQSIQTKKWHLFAVTQKKESRPKSYDRVREEVKRNYFLENSTELSPDFVLATYDGGHITEDDYQFLRKEIPVQHQKKYTKSNLLDLLLIWEISVIETAKHGIDTAQDTRSLMIRETDAYWSEIYRDSVIQNTFGFSKQKLESAFDQNKVFFSEDPNAKYTETSNEDIALFLTMTERDLQLEYHINPEKYFAKDTLQPYQDVRYLVFQNTKPAFYGKPMENLIQRLKDKYQYTVEDTSYIPFKITDAKAALEKAQVFYEKRKLQQALNQYRAIRIDLKEHTSLQDSLCMNIAQIHIELRRYKEALKEYRRLLYLYPDSPNNDKAQFMIGFILAENLNKEQQAIEAFRTLIDRHPQSDLVDDANWMIKNIQSGGALVPNLEAS